MHCRRCGTPLEKPGDYCLTCHTENSDAVVVDGNGDPLAVRLVFDRLGDSSLQTPAAVGANWRPSKLVIQGTKLDTGLKTGFFGVERHILSSAGGG